MDNMIPTEVLEEWKRLEDAFHDNLPSQGECGDPSHGKALCQFLYDNSETIRAALSTMDNRSPDGVTDEMIEAGVEAYIDTPDFLDDAALIEAIYTAMQQAQPLLVSDRSGERMREALESIMALIPKNTAAWGVEQEIVDIARTALDTPKGELK